ncbi:MAG: UbiX family flavin prenyltransferase [Proteobacteria bacterium]|jgi:4-hydroxy-3-polyprenylbenzoate decarboxylase|uniref:Flavin prenyltransferase UbiX n=1 Tax=SAR92 bacterium BACL26 MAG-121220-bin70 TaxID=1655626 RepID=A0A0R2UA91_9GAMM|nr:MAG: 3-octaprenyl-4-hydroxybenzoate carboxy-lyase [SAR92 bacterium BACL26 MAG-121220-bin70]MDA0796352.1 UbiX family flavin prenyltransferase [Pseudomonadota bacterium]MDA1352208.1 UbiX family flavin prenyltransferase [Pseudomonadota bacterium]|tara:strand:- start:676 stop:1242 length:567 start_codon:yes stop_codon:yes gene_type:complete
MVRLIVGMSGSSGVIYGIRILEKLANNPEIETHLIMSQAARMNVGIETDWKAEDVEALADVVHNNKNIGASIASGSFKTAGMVVVPCSMKTLSGIASSYADNLIIRAADVALKERRRLVIMPRESPLHSGHCELMLKASQLGAIICPPSPAFYSMPKTVDDIINHSVARILDLFDIETESLERWQGNV